MRRLLRSLQGRLILTYMVLMLLAIGGLVLWLGLRLQNAALEATRHDLEIQSYVMANGVRDALEAVKGGKRLDPRALDALLRLYSEGTGARVTLVGDDRRVLYSTDSQVRVQSEDDDAEIEGASAGHDASEIRRDAWSDTERLFIAAPVTEDSGKMLGYVQLSVPMAPLYAQMRGTWLMLVAAGGVLLLLTALVSVWMARQIARPIQSLTTATEDIAAGHLDRSVTPGGPDEIERLGKAFNQMADQVRAMLDRQRSFTAHAAHELRTPLTSLALRLEMLQTYGDKDPSMTQGYLPQMERDVQHLRDLVDHLLALAAVEEHDQPAREPVDLALVLYEVADSVAPLARQAGLSLRVDVPAHLPPVLAHTAQMRIVARNLLDNAVKYTPQGGQVALSARAEKDQVVVAVSDSGPGIPPDALPRIFERFYRGNGKAARRSEGTGLGLSLVESIVTAHGGRVSVSSEMGKGSVFTVWLPVAGK
ncbi:MAG: ATP-binding protein [Anaerolineae bacterium]